MPVPSLVTDLSTTAASNSPAGSENVFPSLDDYLRAQSAFLASIRDNSGNGWVSPYLPLAGGTVTGATTFSSTVALNGALSGTGLTTYLASPPAIGGTAAAAVSSTNLSYTGTLTGGTGVVNLGSGQFYKDASGNMGIGTIAPGSFEGTVKTVIGGGAGSPILTLYGGNATYSGLYFADGVTGNEKYRGFFEYDHSTDALRIGTTGSTKATLDSSGNLGLGVTPSAFKSTFKTLQIREAVFSCRDDGFVSLTKNNYVSSDNIDRYISNGTAQAYVMDLAGPHIWFTAPSGTAGNPITYTERMRIDSSGNLLVGQTGSGPFNLNSTCVAPGITGGVDHNHANGTASGIMYERFNYNATTIGSITQSGTTAVLYNTTSDQRLKTNIVDAPDASALIDSIKVRSFDWLADDSHQRYGFVAQELMTVAPEAVHQPADPEDMMAVDYSKLVPMLVKEIQSLRARVAALEA
jgi:hypothetical protein